MDDPVLIHLQQKNAPRSRGTSGKFIVNMSSGKSTDVTSDNKADEIWRQKKEKQGTVRLLEQKYNKMTNKV